jgi:anti-sigma regulatory factor (Ser/Thr protein kinase)
MDAPETQVSEQTTAMLRALPTDQDAPGAARVMAHEMLAGLGCHGAERRQDLILAVSELVSNAVIHGPPGGLTLSLVAAGTVVRVEVGDPGVTPFPMPDGFGADGHWGLRLVQQVSDRSGIDWRPSTVAWFEIDLAA